MADWVIVVALAIVGAALIAALSRGQRASRLPTTPPIIPIDQRTHFNTERARELEIEAADGAKVQPPVDPAP